jgi:hypothetical protein
MHCIFERFFIELVALVFIGTFGGKVIYRYLRIVDKPPAAILDRQTECHVVSNLRTSTEQPFVEPETLDRNTSVAHVSAFQYIDILHIASTEMMISNRPAEPLNPTDLEALASQHGTMLVNPITAAHAAHIRA